MWRISWFLICLLAIPTSAQLVPRANLSDPEASALEQQYQHVLCAIAAESLGNGISSKVNPRSTRSRQQTLCWEEGFLELY